MTTIADNLREVLHHLKEGQLITGSTPADAFILKERIASALTEFPDPDAVGECVEALRQHAVTINSSGRVALEECQRIQDALAKLETP